MAKKSKIQETKKAKEATPSSLEKKTSAKSPAPKSVATSKKVVAKKTTASAKKPAVAKTVVKKASASEKTTKAVAKKAAPTAAKASNSDLKNKKAKESSKKASEAKLKQKDKNKAAESDENDVVPNEDLDIIAKELLEKEEKLARRKQNQEKKNVPQTIKTIPSVKIAAASADLSLPVNFRNGGKEKFEMEFQVRSSIKILYNFICSPSGLSEWFSDNVNIQNDVFIFQWEGSEEEARLLALKEFELVRFKWLHSTEDDTYFEMKIKVEELTGDVAIVITDFAYKEELQEAQLLWDTQIQNLLKALGSA